MQFAETMSAIDQYKHRCLRTIECPSTFDIVYKNSTRKIAIYELLESIPDDKRSFDGKAGDIIVGGGSGEAPAFRISIPEAFHFFTHQGWDDFNVITDLYKAFWTPTQPYIFCEGFSKLGWKTNTPIESWLAKNICLLLIDEVESYHIFKNGLLQKSIFTLNK